MIPYFYINYCNRWIRLQSMTEPEIYVGNKIVNIVMAGRIFIGINEESLYNYFYKEYTLNKKRNCFVFTNSNFYSALLKNVQYSFNEISFMFEVSTIKKINTFTIKQEFPILID